MLNVIDGGLAPQSIDGGVAPQSMWVRRPGAPQGSELARLFGDRNPFQLAKPAIKRASHMGRKGMWVSVHFGSISRGSTRFDAPDLDCHITLMYTQKTLSAGPMLSLLDKRIEELQKRVDKSNPAALLGAGVVCDALGFPDYMWLDILVASQLHCTLCCWASRLTKDFVPTKDFFGKPAFHISFATATTWQEQS